MENNKLNMQDLVFISIALESLEGKMHYTESKVRETRDKITDLIKECIGTSNF
jgi:hypothetical protein